MVYIFNAFLANVNYMDACANYLIAGGTKFNLLVAIISGISAWE